MDSNFNNENDPWEFGFDIDDFDLYLTPVLCSSSSTRVEPSPLTPNLVRIIPDPASIVQLSSSRRVEPSPTTPNPVRIIPDPASIKVIEDVGEDDDFKIGLWVSATNYVTANGGTITGCTIPGTIHHKVIGDGGYGKDIIVGAVMVLTNVSVFTPEFVALVAAGKEAEWLRNLILEISIWPKLIALISMYCDSAATLAKAYSQMYNGKSRHLGFRHIMIRELIMNDMISIEFVRSQQNLADHLMKGLARDLVNKPASDVRLKFTFLMVLLKKSNAEHD
ncbi:hypothetical protein Tco_0126584 [Tanacetum coccineum]